jgi:hypothetical protein
MHVSSDGHLIIVNRNVPLYFHSGYVSTAGEPVFRYSIDRPPAEGGPKEIRP